MRSALLALSIACLVYGVTIFLTFSGTLFFCVWFALGAVLAGCSFALHLGLWDALANPIRWGVVSLAALLLVGCLGLSGLIMRESAVEPPQDLDYLIVLGAQIYRHGPSVVLRYRLDAAYDYLADNPRTRCVVAGGQGPNEPFPEADGMADYLVGRGISRSRIVCERTSTTTVENIANSWKLMGGRPARVGIVTNDFHLFRAVRIARKMGIGEAHGVAGGSKPWYLPNNLLRECLGVVKDLAAGNMSL